MPNQLIEIDLTTLEQHPQDQELVAALLAKFDKDTNLIYISRHDTHKIVVNDPITHSKQTRIVGLSHNLVRYRKYNTFLDRAKIHDKRYYRYNVIAGEPLGKGAHGQVDSLPTSLFLSNGHLQIKYKSRTVKTQIPRECNRLESIMREARLAMRIPHLHAKPLSINDENECTALVMRRAPGVSLQTILENPERYRLSTEQRYLLSINCLHALREQLHTQDVIHGDIKPDNMIVDLNTLQVTFIDLGLGDFISNPEDTASRGTDGYIAPEIYRGNPPTIYSDIFAMGMVLANVWADGKHNLIFDSDTALLKFLNDAESKQNLHETLFTFPTIRDLNETEKKFIRSGITAATYLNANKRPPTLHLIEHFITLYANHRYRTAAITLERGNAMKAVIDFALELRLNMRNQLLNVNLGHEVIAQLDEKLPHNDFELQEFHRIFGSQILQQLPNREAILNKIHDEQALTSSNLDRINSFIEWLASEASIYQPFIHIKEIAQRLHEIHIIENDANKLKHKLNDAYHFDRRCELNAKYHEKIEKLILRAAELFSESTPISDYFQKQKGLIKSLQNTLPSDSPSDRLINAIKHAILEYMQHHLSGSLIKLKQRAASTKRLEEIAKLVEILDTAKGYSDEVIVLQINSVLDSIKHGPSGSNLRNRVLSVIKEYNREVTRAFNRS